MDLQEICDNLRRRTGWMNLKVEHSVGRRQVKWSDAGNYHDSVCIIGVRGPACLLGLYEVYGRPFKLLTREEQKFIESLLCSK